MQAGLSRLTSHFEMREGGVDYGEQVDSWLDPDTSELWPKPIYLIFLKEDYYV